MLPGQEVGLREQPNSVDLPLSFQMLSTVLNIIIFEDCRNQWSMSRPLLGLILLNEKVGRIKLTLIRSDPRT